MKREAPSSTLIVFAKEPKDGRVKTRLLKDLPSDFVTSLYKAFVRDVLSISAKARCDQKIIYYTGGRLPLPFLSQFGRKFLLKQQQGQDLGMRMRGAFRYALKRRGAKAVIVGTDCLSMTEDDINLAFKKLDRYDCVLGPSRDGGYYLIGLKKADVRLFQGIRWSTASVLSNTLNRAKKLKWKVHLLKTREDVDTVEALRRFVNLMRGYVHVQSTKKVVKEYKSLL